MKRNLFIFVMLIISCNSNKSNPLIRGTISDANGNLVSNAIITLSLNMPSTQNGLSISYDMPDINNILVWIEDECTEDTVKVLVNGIQQPGHHTIKWNGQNSDSMYVKSGLYHYKIISDSYENYTSFIYTFDYYDMTYEELEPFAVTNEDGYFEFEQECIPFGYEFERIGEKGNILGLYKIPREIVIRAFHPNYVNISKDNLTVDKDNGLEVNLQFN